MAAPAVGAAVKIGAQVASTEKGRKGLFFLLALIVGAPVAMVATAICMVVGLVVVLGTLVSGFSFSVPAASGATWWAKYESVAPQVVEMQVANGGPVPFPLPGDPDFVACKMASEHPEIFDDHGFLVDLGFTNLAWESFCRAVLTEDSDAVTVAWWLISQPTFQPMLWYDGYEQIEAIANGNPGSCLLSPTVLRLVAFSVATLEGRLSLSDANRACIGKDNVGGGRTSSHWIGGGFYAVDFAIAGGRALTGRDPMSQVIARLAETFWPEGYRIGQSQCGPLDFQQVRGVTFEDTCHHLHADISRTEEMTT